MNVAIFISVGLLVLLFQQLALSHVFFRYRINRYELHYKLTVQNRLWNSVFIGIGVFFFLITVMYSVGALHNRFFSLEWWYGVANLIYLSVNVIIFMLLPRQIWEHTRFDPVIGSPDAVVFPKWWINFFFAGQGALYSAILVFLYAYFAYTL